MKDENIYLRGGTKKKNGIMNYLLLQKRYKRKYSIYSHNTAKYHSYVSSINTSFNSTTSTTDTNELRVINEQRKLHINDNTKIPVVVNNTSNNNDVILVNETIMESTSILDSNLNDVDNGLMVINNYLYLMQQRNEKHLRFVTETKHDHDDDDNINGNLLWPKGMCNRRFDYTRIR